MSWQSREAQDSPRRFIYLLVVWQERPASPDEAAIWRFSLEDARTGDRRGFATPQALVDFLRHDPSL
jgi:hypothetical protein